MWMCLKLLLIALSALASKFQDIEIVDDNLWSWCVLQILWFSILTEVMMIPFPRLSSSMGATWWWFPNCSVNPTYRIWRTVDKVDNPRNIPKKSYSRIPIFSQRMDCDNPRYFLPLDTLGWYKTRTNHQPTTIHLIHHMFKMQTKYHEQPTTFFHGWLHHNVYFTHQSYGGTTQVARDKPPQPSRSSYIWKP